MIRPFFLSAAAFFLAFQLQLSPAAGQTPGGGAAASALVKMGYQISYEVTVCAKNGSASIQFFSARHPSESNVIHVAVVEGLGKGARAGIRRLEAPARVSDIARSSKAALAVNGGYFAIMKGKIYTLGDVCVDYTRKHPYVIPHAAYPYLCVDGAGIPSVMSSRAFRKKTGKKRYEYYLQTKPLLVSGGKIPSSLMASREAGTSKNPRTAFGVTKEGFGICVIVEGRRSDAAGMSQVGLAKLIAALGAVDAINLDGGGSSTAVLNGVLMNRPSGGLSPFTMPGEERPVHSALIFTM